MYKALYRKWRPKCFDDVIGQDAITTTLKNEVSEGKVAHAYLFTGSRGTGKTTCSKILAKAVNCPHQKDGNPCMVCDVCKGIDDGSILDVVEIDAASNNGVENVRSLREEALFTPASVKYRVYIIDEAHMLSQGAANALLKIMEEPPAHVIFILATTEVHKLPATILSRCQRFDFKRVDSDVIAQRLLYIAEQESVILQPEAAEMIAKLSDGGVRDALSLLDTCISRNTTVDLSVVAEVSGMIGQAYLFDLADAVCEKDCTKALQILQDIYENAVDFDRLCHQLIQHYRNLMLVSASAQAASFIVAMPDELERLTQQAKRYKLSEIFWALDVLSETLPKLSRTAYKKTEVEMAILQLCLRDRGAFSESLANRLEQLEAKVASLIANGVPTQQEAPQAAQRPAPQTQRKAEKPKPVPQTQANQPSGGEVPFAGWSQVQEKLKTRFPPLYGVLLHAQAYQSGDLILIDCEEPLFLEMIRNNEYTKKALRETISEVTGQKFRLGPYKRKPQETAAADPLEDIIQTVQKMNLQEE